MNTKNNRALIALALGLTLFLFSRMAAVSAASVGFNIQASDSADSYSRYWEIWIDKSPGSYLSDGVYQNSPDAQTIKNSGATWSFSMDTPQGSHTLYFEVTQSGGSSLGYYSGTITTSTGTTCSFSNVDAYHPATCPITVPTTSTTSMPSTTTTVSQYYICTYANPNNIGGGFYLNGQFYGDGGRAPIQIGTYYTLSSSSIAGYNFGSWSTSRGGVHITNQYSSSTSVYFDASGWDSVCVGDLAINYHTVTTTIPTTTYTTSIPTTSYTTSVYTTIPTTTIGYSTVHFLMQNDASSSGVAGTITISGVGAFSTYSFTGGGWTSAPSYSVPNGQFQITASPPTGYVFDSNPPNSASFYSWISNPNYCNGLTCNPSNPIYYQNGFSNPTTLTLNNFNGYIIVQVKPIATTTTSIYTTIPTTSYTTSIYTTIPTTTYTTSIPTTSYTTSIPTTTSYSTTISTSTTSAPTTTSSSTTSTSTSASSSSTSESTSMTTTPTTASTSTIGGGGGGGGTAGGSFGGTFLPTVTRSPNGECFQITNFSRYNSETVILHGTTFTIDMNFISPDQSGVSVNNVAYTLQPNEPVNVTKGKGYNFYIKLTNISYIPLDHSITIEFCSAPIINVNLSVNGNTIIATSSNKNNTVELLANNNIIATGKGTAMYNNTEFVPGTYALTGRDLNANVVSQLTTFTKPKFIPTLKFVHECANYTYNSSKSCTTTAEIISNGNQLVADLFLNNRLINTTNALIEDTESQAGIYYYVFSTVGNSNYTNAGTSYIYTIGNAIVLAPKPVPKDLLTPALIATIIAVAAAVAYSTDRRIRGARGEGTEENNSNEEIPETEEHSDNEEIPETEENNTSEDTGSNEESPETEEPES